MKKPTGRRPSFTRDIMRIIGEKSASGELTLRETSRIYGVSHGAVSAWKKNFAVNTPQVEIQSYHPKLFPPSFKQKTEMEAELRLFMNELALLDDEILALAL